MIRSTLPYPCGINLMVFRDDGKWNECSRWFMRSAHELDALLVARITLGHYADTEEPAYTADEWARKSQQLIETYPDCVFVYAAAEFQES